MSCIDLAGLGDGLDVGRSWLSLIPSGVYLSPKWVAFDGKNAGRDLGFLDGGGDKGQIMSEITDVSISLDLTCPLKR